MRLAMKIGLVGTSFAILSCGNPHTAMVLSRSAHVSKQVAAVQPVKSDTVKNDKSHEKRPSHVPDFPPLVQEGIRLYGENCASCHGNSIETSTKRNRSAAEITAALQSQPSMKGIMNLDAPKIDRIAAALAFDFTSVLPGAEPPRSAGPLLSTRFGITSALNNLFWDGAPGTEAAFKLLADAPFSDLPGIFGFPCLRYDKTDGVCPTPDASRTATLLPTHNPMRSAVMRSTCENLAGRPETLSNVLRLAFGSTPDAALPEDPAKVKALLALFLPGYEAQASELQAFTGLGAGLLAQGRSVRERWSFLTALACQHPQFELRSQVNSKKLLTPVALYARCYEAVTQLRPHPDSPVLAAVAKGTKQPIPACLETFAKARLVQTAPGNVWVLPDTSGEARAILRTFHALHFSWFENKDFPGLDDKEINGKVRDVWDATIPASYFTSALLVPGRDLTSVFRGRSFLTPVRSMQNPPTGIFPPSVKPTLQYGPATWTSPQLMYADRGKLNGFRAQNPDEVWTFSARLDATSNPINGNVTPYSSLGGGVLGNSSYLAMTAQVPRDYRPDGAVNVPRRWSRAVYSDFLCRSLPVLRPSDVEKFVVPSSPTSFRTTATCTSCHSSMDPMAGLVRGLRTDEATPVAMPPTFVTFFVPFHPPVAAPWSDVPDPKYWERPATGRFHYRTRSDVVVERALANMDDLGQVLLEQDDLYTCLTGRYYSYFLGVDIEQALAPKSKHGPVIHSLATALRKNKNLEALVSSIVSLPHYRMSDFEPE